jgi:ribosomal protein S18 acetylase RimI-like enzyme
MAITVRRATSKDGALLSAFNAEVQAIHAEALPGWFKPPGPRQFPPAEATALLKNSSNLIFIAEIGADPAGCVFAGVTRQAETPWRYAYDMIYVYEIGVRAACRRRGVGAALIGAVRAEAASRNVALLGLDVWSFNADARAFFQRQGFAPYNDRWVCRLSEAGR